MARLLSRQSAKRTTARVRVFIRPFSVPHPNLQYMGKGVSYQESNRTRARTFVALCGGALIATGLYSLLSSEEDKEEDASAERVSKEEEVAVAALPSLEDAQRTEVVRVPSLMSLEEIEEILQAVKALKPRLGTAARDRDGVRQMQGSWETTYLNTDGLFAQEYPALFQKIFDTALRVDAANWKVLTGKEDRLNVRVLEYHEVTKHGGLANPLHFDGGSLVTIDIMLADPLTEFDGGSFCTLESDGSLQRHPFLQGDSCVFLSHKRHCVEDVTSGMRKVLIMEVWEGDERRCAHRCLQRFGPCSFSASRSWLERIFLGQLPDGASDGPGG